MPQTNITLAPLLTLLLSALISLIVAWVTSRRAIALEAEKARFSVQQKTFELMLARRLQTYPEIYALLSDLAKTFDVVPTVCVDLRKMLERFNAWDSQNSLVMSLDTSNHCHEFRMALVAAVHAKRRPSSDDQFIDLRQLAERLELALRTDLGLHGIGLDTAHDLTPRPRSTY